jgi:hypothetical protein
MSPINLLENKQNKSSYKYKKDQYEEYMNSLQEKCEKTIPIIKKNKKITSETIVIPSIELYDDIFNFNYNAQQLKIFAKYYKIKTTGNKQQLFLRIYTFLKLSFLIIKIQKLFRGHIQRKYNKLHGPAFIKRKLCTNDNDFLTGDEVEIIPSSQFISFKDNDNFIYGFDAISLYNLIFKSGTITKNPYNRCEIPDDVINNLKSFIRISRILKIPLEIELKDDTDELSDEKVLELRTLSLFQNIDALGNYSSPNWFLSLNRIQTKRMMRELVDIWNYRAQITAETKCAICPPNGNLTNQITLHYIFNETNIHKMRKYIIEIFERLVNSGIDQDSKSLGAYYVLGALTLVNETAASSLPWLFQSFSYF